MVLRNMIISYDLRNHRDYNSLFKALNDLGAFRILESVWFLKTSSTAVECKNYLGNYIDNDDSLVVFDCTFNTGDVLRCYNEVSLRNQWAR